MGVLNITPDSFSDGGRCLSPEAAADAAARLLSEGADLLDLGAESTRPGATPIDATEELRRLLPALAAVRARCGEVRISVDTYKSLTASLAAAAGADMINDVHGLQGDPAMAETVAAAQVGVCIMHFRARADADIDILDDILRFWDISLDLARRAGIAQGQIMLDPGIGFGKTDAQTRQIFRALPRLCAVGFPVLVGASRKSFLGRLTGREDPLRREAATLAAHLAAAEAGAAVLRVHDPAPHRDALKVWQALRPGAA